MEEIRQLLTPYIDETYAEFQRKLIPNLRAESILGIRTPQLRALAKDLENTELASLFLEEKEHSCFEEDQLHAFLISSIKDFDVCLMRIEEFLPHVNNWATCDQLLPKVFKKHRQELLPVLRQWLQSEHTYTVRFAIGQFMRLYLDSEFKPEYLDLITGIHSSQYYVNMMIAWYLATALAKQWEATIPVLLERRTDPWVHNKAIQKAIESYRITEEQKTFLRTLKSNTSRSNRL